MNHETTKQPKPESTAADTVEITVEGAESLDAKKLAEIRAELFPADKLTPELIEAVKLSRLSRRAMTGAPTINAEERHELISRPITVGEALDTGQYTLVPVRN